MADEQPGRIEIELTSHAPRRERRIRGAADATGLPAPDLPRPGPTGDDSSATGGSDPVPAPARAGGLLASERSRLVATAGAVGVVALLLGWMLGRSDGGEPAAEPGDAPATVAPTSTSDPEDDDRFGSTETLPGTDLDEVTPPATRPPIVVPPPSTEAPAPSTSVPLDQLDTGIELDPRLVGIDTTLVGVDRERRLVEIDLSSGSSRVLGEGFSVSAERVFAGPDWVIVPSYNASSVVVVHDDGRRASIDALMPWSTFVDTVDGMLWGTPIEFEGIGPIRYEEFDLSGAPTGRAVELPNQAWPAAFDGDGFIVSAAGSTYRVTPEGSELLVRGQLTAASADRLVVSTCDDALRCGIQIVDRDTGDTRWLDEAGDTDVTYYPIDYYSSGRTNESLSPDGRLLAAMRLGSGEEMGILDLETGEFAELGRPSFGNMSWVWGDGIEFAFYLDAGRAMAVDLASSESFPIATEGAQGWSALTARP